MKERVVNKIVLNIKTKNNTIDDVKVEEIRYGLLGLYSLLTKSTVIIILAFILNIYKEFFIFLLFYGILRSLGYGCHAKSNLYCWLYSTLLLLGIPYTFNSINISFTLKIILWSCLFLDYLIFCPADTEKRPMINKVRKLKFKVAILLVSLVYLFFIIKYDNISNLVIGAMLLQGILVNPLGYILMGQKVRFKLNDINLFKQNRSEV